MIERKGYRVAAPLFQIRSANGDDTCQPEQHLFDAIDTTQVIIFYLSDFQESDKRQDAPNLGNDAVIVCGYFRKLIRGVAGGW